MIIKINDKINDNKNVLVVLDVRLTRQYFFL